MSGVHALVGLGLGFGFGVIARSRERPLPAALIGVTALGFAVGSLLPDIDFILTTALWFLDETTADRMHRTFTHSFVTLLPFVLGGGLLYASGNRKRGLLVLGIVGGMTSHVVLDLLFWFEDVGALWPLHAFSDEIPFWISLYGDYEPPALFTKVIFSWEYGSLALYVGVLYYLSEQFGTNETYRSRLKLWGGVYLLVFLVALALIPLFELETFQVIVFAPSAPFFWPLAVWITVKMRETIEQLAQDGLAGRPATA